ncbi:MAG: glycoside hydrolase [Ruminococcus sp.]|nr:glycoside hydrolase [Ruminococcus sp.]
MDIKKIAAAAAAAAMVTSGCGKTIEKNKDPDTRPVTTTTTTVTEATLPAPVTEPPEPVIPEYDEVKIKAGELTYTEYSELRHAETGVLAGGAVVAADREGYHGDGYVTGITSDGDWAVYFDLPETQYYNITVTAAADEKLKCSLSVNDGKISEFTSGGTGEFESFTFKNIRLEKGKSRIALVPDEKAAFAPDVDSIEIVSSEDITKLPLTVKKTTALSNKNADYKTQAVYSFICESYGKKIILGQYDVIDTEERNYETELIYRTTGKYPAIRFGDVRLLTAGKDCEEAAQAELDAAIKYSKDGGLVGLMWNWLSVPGEGDNLSFELENSELNIKDAVTEEDIAELDIEEIRQLNEDGVISDECLQIVEDIDTVSEGLKKLRNKGVTVLWRPLHEASNGYYWWGKDKKSYKWLWGLMYDRMTGYHELNNLIWVWSAQNSGWYVGDKKCDILSVDVYSDNGSKDGQVNSLLYMSSVSTKKPIAMSECGSLPLVQSLADERAMWAYIGQWGVERLVSGDGSIAEEYNKTEDLIKIYNSDIAITRDELPDFEEKAKELKEKDESEAEE